jgi:cytochrome bd-type quinol oxidase subunit 1
VALSIIAFVIAYSALLVVEMFLMVRTIRQGPGYVEVLPARLTHVITLPTPVTLPAE